MKRLNFWYIAAAWAIACAVALSLTSCKTIQVVEHTRTEYVRDTLRMRDTLQVERVRVERQQGDTIFITNTETRYETRWRDKVVEVEKTDSIPYPVEVVKEVHVRNWYDRATSGGFWTLLVCVLLSISWRVLKVLRKNRII